MRTAILLLVGGMLAFSVPAHAGSGKLVSLIKDTEIDYKTVKGGFSDAMQGADIKKAAWKAKARANLEVVSRRIQARRKAIGELRSFADGSLQSGEKGVVKMALKELDAANLSLLALITSDKGYAGFIRTGDDALMDGISNWQSGVGLAIKQTKRLVDMAGTMAWQGGRPATPAYFRVH